MTQTKITLAVEDIHGKFREISKIIIKKDVVIAEDAQTKLGFIADRKSALALAKMYKLEEGVVVDIDEHFESDVKNEQPKEEIAEVKTEDYRIYAIDDNGKKTCFKVSEVTSAKFRTKKAVKQCFEANGYKVQKVLTEDEDRAWDEFMGLGYDVNETTLWKYFRKSYKTGFCEKWNGKEWVDGWM